MEKEGIKELKEVVALAIGLANAGIKIGKDGKIGLDDVGHLMAVVMLIAPAVDGITKLPAEVLDLSAPEAAEVIAEVAATLAVDDAKAKAVVLAAIKLAASGKDLVSAIVG
jgi:cell pole-organizing protein PopZ